MLQQIRERAQGWVAWAIVILISVPFAFWGIDSYFGGGADPFVAKVNGTEISERAFDQTVQSTRIELRERLGAAYDPSLFDNQRLRQQVLDRMVRDAVLLDASDAMGLRVSDDAVRAAVLAEPFFQDNGVFSNETYQRVLRQQGMTPAGFEQNLRARLLATQLPRALTDSEFVTPDILAETTRLRQQRRDVATITLDPAAFMPEAPPSEAAIQAWYDEHQSEFQTPEQVKIAYLLLDANALAASPEAVLDDAALRERYEARIAEFTVPEQRRMRHILVTVPTDGDAEAVRERLLAVRERILAGEDFAALATELSEDPGSASAGGDLGLVGRGLMDPAFEQAAFALAVNSPSEPVRTRFGYHLIEVTAVEGGGVEPFETVREQLLAEADAGRAEAVFFEVAERLATLTYESADSLVPAAEALDLPIQTTDWLDRSGGEGVFANPRVIAAAFSPDVLELGNNSELIEPEAEVMQAIVLRVDEHREPALRPLDEVRDDIIAAIRKRDAAAAALAEARALVDRLEAGEALEAVAGTRPVERAGAVTRTAASVPPDALALAFALPRPGAGAVSYGSAERADGGAVVVAVTGVTDGDAAAMTDVDRRAENDVLRGILARAASAAVLDDLEQRARIERRPLREETDL